MTPGPARNTSNSSHSRPAHTDGAAQHRGPSNHQAVCHVTVVPEQGPNGPQSAIQTPPSRLLGRRVPVTPTATVTWACQCILPSRPTGTGTGPDGHCGKPGLGPSPGLSRLALLGFLEPGAARHGRHGHQDLMQNASPQRQAGSESSHCL
jgi:hypothetical protein